MEVERTLLLRPQACWYCDDEPCLRLLITSSQALNQDKLHTLVNLFTPGLERFYRKESTIHPSQEHAMFVAEYKTANIAANAMEMLHGLNSMLFDCHGQLFIKFY